MGGFQVMPFIKFFCCNVRHAVALVIYFSFYLLISLHFSFHLSTFREYSGIGKIITKYILKFQKKKQNRILYNDRRNS